MFKAFISQSVCFNRFEGRLLNILYSATLIDRTLSESTRFFRQSKWCFHKTDARNGSSKAAKSQDFKILIISKKKGFFQVCLTFPPIFFLLCFCFFQTRFRNFLLTFFSNFSPTFPQLFLQFFSNLVTIFFFFLEWSHSSRKLVRDKSLLGPNLFDPKLTRLMHLSSLRVYLYRRVPVRTILLLPARTKFAKIFV